MKKEREIIEILEKEERWRYNSNTTSEEKDIGKEGNDILCHISFTWWCYKLFSSILSIVSFEILTVVTMRITVYWDVISCSLILLLNMFLCCLVPPNGSLLCPRGRLWLWEMMVDRQDLQLNMGFSPGEGGYFSHVCERSRSIDFQCTYCVFYRRMSELCNYEIIKTRWQQMHFHLDEACPCNRSYMDSSSVEFHFCTDPPK